MTTATAERADAGSLATGPERTLGIWTASLQAAWNKHRAYRTTLAELKGLTDGQLRDVGTSRAGLKQFAHQAVYGS